MWSNKIVKKNIKYLKKLGIHIFNPQTGKLSLWNKRFGEIDGNK